MRVLSRILIVLLLSTGSARADEAAVSANGLTLFRSPLLSQVMLLQLPQDFKRAFRNTEEKAYTEEFIRDGESVDQWTQMISLVAYKDLSLSLLASPDQHVKAVANLFRRNCPDSYSGMNLGAMQISGRYASAAIMSCGLVKPENPYSETTLFIVIQGEKDFFTIQWNEHGLGSNQPIRFDPSLWKGRLESLEPIRLCDDKPDEYPFYPGCIRDEHDSGTAK